LVKTAGKATVRKIIIFCGLLQYCSYLLNNSRRAASSFPGEEYGESQDRRIPPDA
jgi:hypothetical protein